MSGIPILTVLSSTDESQAAIEYLALQKKVQLWMEMIIGKEFMEGSDFSIALADGVALCDLVNAVDPGAIPRITRKTKLKMKYLENVNQVLGFFQRFGVDKELFGSLDLLERKNMKKVITSINKFLEMAHDKGKVCNPPTVDRNAFSSEEILEACENLQKYGAHVKYTTLRRRTQSTYIGQNDSSASKPKSNPALIEVRQRIRAGSVIDKKRALEQSKSKEDKDKDKDGRKIDVRDQLVSDRVDYYRGVEDSERPVDIDGSEFATGKNWTRGAAEAEGDPSHPDYRTGRVWRRAEGGGDAEERWEEAPKLSHAEIEERKKRQEAARLGLEAEAVAVADTKSPTSKSAPLAPIVVVQPVEVEDKGEQQEETSATVDVEVEQVVHLQAPIAVGAATNVDVDESSVGVEQEVGVEGEKTPKEEVKEEKAENADMDVDVEGNQAVVSVVDESQSQPESEEEREEEHADVPQEQDTVAVKDDSEAEGDTKARGSRIAFTASDENEVVPTTFIFNEEYNDCVAVSVTVSFSFDNYQSAYRLWRSGHSFERLLYLEASHFYEYRFNVHMGNGKMVSMYSKDQPIQTDCDGHIINCIDVPKHSTVARQLHSGDSTVGEVYIWGADFTSDVVSDFGHSESVTPKLLSGFQKRPAKSIGCGAAHSVVLLQSGEVFVFGSNDFGQLGLGNQTAERIPRRIESLVGKKIVKVACGFMASAFLTDSGQLYMCGQNDSSQCGRRTEMPYILEPTLVEGELAGQRVVDMKLGFSGTLALTEGGSLYSWGRGDQGELGHALHASETDVVQPKRIVGLKFKKIAGFDMGYYHSACCTDRGDLMVFGSNSKSQLGSTIAIGKCIFSPIRIGEYSSLKGLQVKAVACGAFHSLAIVFDPAEEVTHVYSWGCADDGRLGIHNEKENESENVAREPQIIPSLSNRRSDSDDPVCKIYCGHRHSICLTESGKVYVFGSNQCGQIGLGEGSVGDVPVPMLINTADFADDNVAIVDVGLGEESTALISSTGSLYTFGDSQHCQLGHRDSVTRFSPSIVEEFEDRRVCQIAAGLSHSLLLDDRGDVYSIGHGEDGQLGHGNTESLKVPRLIEGLLSKNIQAVACGDRFSLALDCDGRCYSFGLGGAHLGHDLGENGDGNSNILVPTLISSEISKHAIMQISAGAVATAFLDYSGVVHVIGENLRDNKMESGEIDEVFINIQCGSTHLIGLTEAGQCFVWGLVQQVDGKYVVTAPKQLDFQGIGVCVDVCAAAFHFACLMQNGDVMTFGKNTMGVLLGHGNGHGNESESDDGDNGDDSIPKPKPVVGISNCVFIACGYFHTIVSCQQGTRYRSYAFGLNDNGQLGIGNATSIGVPTDVKFDANENVLIFRCCGGKDFTLAVCSREELPSDSVKETLALSGL